MKAIITKTSNTQAKLRIYRDQYSLKIPSTFSTEDKELLKNWRVERIERAKSLFEEHRDLQEVKEHISSDRLSKFYNKLKVV